MQVNVQYAKTHLSRLISQVESGGEVIIARNGKPAVKMVAISPSIRKSRKYMRGSGIGKIWMTDDAFSPETDALIEGMFKMDDPL